MRRLAVIGLVLLSPSESIAWSRVGHQTVALIAEGRLSPAARTELEAVLGPGVGLADIAGCPDSIKRRPIRCADAFDVPRDPSSSKHHYINIPVKDSPTPATVREYCRIHGSAKACIIDRIEDGLSVIKSTSSRRSEKQLALMFVVHYIGDLHTPLHNAFAVDGRGRGDAGGNGAEVWFLQSAKAKRPTSLHHIWDNMLESDSALRRTTASVYAARLARELATKPTEDWLKSDLDQAAYESFRISKDVIYPAYRSSGSRLTKAYQERMQPVAFEQIQKAGVRLAGLLEHALVR